MRDWHGLETGSIVVEQIISIGESLARFSALGNPKISFASWQMAALETMRRVATRPPMGGPVNRLS